MWRWVRWNGVMDECSEWRTATWTQNASSPNLWIESDATYFQGCRGKSLTFKEKKTIIDKY